MPELIGPGVTVAVALAAGMVFQVAARHLQVPGIVLLLLAGVLLGPEALGLVRPETLGHALEIVVGMCVAVILFEGGLNLSVDRLRREAVTLRRLVTVGAVITALGGTLAGRYIMGWSWELAVPFGTLVVVTGPTVVQPILRRVRLRPQLETILEGEAVLIDALGAVAAVVALEVVLATSMTEAATGFAGLPGRLLLGAGLGLGGGLAVGVIIRRQRVIPEGLENVFVLSLVLVLFEISEAILPESGIMTAAMAGITVGNMNTGIQKELKEFKEQLTIMLLGLLFVLLAATVEIADVIALGWPGIATVLVLMLVVRPADVAISTMGSDLSLQERAFLAWLAPRGIVAAAVASLFGQWLQDAGISGGAELQALVFMVIAVTVLVQGGLAGAAASVLGVRRETDEGWIVVGANALGRCLAKILRAAGEEIMLVDSSADNCQVAEDEGLPVVFGNATEERTLKRARAPLRRGLVAVTTNEAVNLIVAASAHEELGVPSVSVALNQRMREIRGDRVKQLGVGVLFGEYADLEYWNHELLHGNIDLGRWRYEGPDESEDGALPGLASQSRVQLLPMVLVRDGQASPVENRVEFEPGDQVYFAWPYRGGERAGQWLADNGWRPVAELVEDEEGEESEQESAPAGDVRP
ncbi:MAG: cation:proton antiporter [Candidatus Palauibacterales bacterium]|nr:cation:proton antiporter [Candidatus Palauibacterales bacterium]